MPVYECIGKCPRDYSPCEGRQESYVGHVLGKREANGYDDSDFYATVWNGERLTEVIYASTRGWTYHNGAVVDATPEIKAAALAWYRERLTALRIESAKHEATQPKVGRRVHTIKGKPVTGEVRWLGVDKYKSTRYITVMRVGIRVQGDSKLHFTGFDNVEVVNPKPRPESEIRAECQHVPEPNWGTALESLAYSALREVTR